MKIRAILLILLGLSCILSACQPAPIIPTATATALPPTSTPVPTDTPEPTATLEPSPTPIVYPDVLDQTFLNVQIVFRDNFDFKMQGIAPDGWKSINDEIVPRVTKSNTAGFTPRSNGGIIYYGAEVINPGEGVFFNFQYDGTINDITLGLDNIDTQGNFFQHKTEGYYSFAAQMHNQTLYGHVIEGPYQKAFNFTGAIKFIQGTWYSCMIALDKENNYILKIWETDSPENQMSYVRNWPDTPKAYYFVSWIGAKRGLLMDEFTIFSFDKMILE